MSENNSDDYEDVDDDEEEDEDARKRESRRASVIKAQETWRGARITLKTRMFFGLMTRRKTLEFKEINLGILQSKLTSDLEASDVSESDTEGGRKRSKKKKKGRAWKISLKSGRKRLKRRRRRRTRKRGKGGKILKRRRKRRRSKRRKKKSKTSKTQKKSNRKNSLSAGTGSDLSGGLTEVDTMVANLAADPPEARRRKDSLVGSSAVLRRQKAPSSARAHQRGQQGRGTHPEPDDSIKAKNVKTNKKEKASTATSQGDSSALSEKKASKFSLLKNKLLLKPLLKSSDQTGEEETENDGDEEGEDSIEKESKDNDDGTANKSDLSESGSGGKTTPTRRKSDQHVTWAAEDYEGLTDEEVRLMVAAQDSHPDKRLDEPVDLYSGDYEIPPSARECWEIYQVVSRYGVPLRLKTLQRALMSPTDLRQFQALYKPPVHYA